jgi:hypothetical protein
MLGEDKNKNGKRIPEIIRETQIIGKKERKLNKKKAKLEKLQEATETIWKTSQTRTSQEAGSQDLNLIGTLGPHKRMDFSLAKLYDHWRHPDC